MATYLIGDVQGCDSALAQLLHLIDFSPSRDTLVLLGDAVNRGPASLGVLRRLQALGDAAQSLLGNHDLHLLAVAAGVRQAHRSDTLDDILQAPDRPALLEWLHHRPLALRREGWLLVHAGLLPEWTGEQALALADEVCQLLRGRHATDWLRTMYGNCPDRWQPSLQGTERWRLVVNALTRLRYCHPDGRMDFTSKEGPGEGTAPGLLPWFDLPQRRSQGEPIAFGHWSTLGLLMRPHLLGLDTGCLWGGQLSAVRITQGQTPSASDLIQLHCPQTRQPG